MDSGATMTHLGISLLPASYVTFVIFSRADAPACAPPCSPAQQQPLWA